MGAFLNGRVVYELMSAFWPTADADPASPPWMVEFARIWRAGRRSSGMSSRRRWRTFTNGTLVCHWI
jgi:hypothetical protein